MIKVKVLCFPYIGFGISFKNWVLLRQSHRELDAQKITALHRFYFVSSFHIARGFAVFYSLIASPRFGPRVCATMLDSWDKFNAWWSPESPIDLKHLALMVLTKILGLDAKVHVLCVVCSLCIAKVQT